MWIYILFLFKAVYFIKVYTQPFSTTEVAPLQWTLWQRTKVVYNMSNTRNYEPGDVVFREGEEGHHAYLIRRGAINVTKIGEDKSQKIIAKLRKGAILGEMALIDDETRSATAIASEPSEVLIIQRDELTARLEKTDPVVYRLLQSLSKRLREQAKIIASLKT